MFGIKMECDIQIRFSSQNLQQANELTIMTED